MFKWTSEAVAAVVELAERLSNQPRAYTSPELLTADGYCLCIRGDADPHAIDTSLWLIHKNDANDITCEDFEHEDPNHAVLLGIRPKSLNKSAAKWHISEKGLLCMVYGVEKFAYRVCFQMGSEGRQIEVDMALWSIGARCSKNLFCI